LVCGCLCVSALHVPRAARAAQAGWQGPYGGDARSEDGARVSLSDKTPRDGESLARASLSAGRPAAGLAAGLADGPSEGSGGGM